MIREITESEIGPFFGLMASLEAGDHYDPGNPRHVEWVRKQISTQFLRGVKFFACYLGDRTSVGIASLLINARPDGVSDCWRGARSCWTSASSTGSMARGMEQSC